MNKTKPAPKDLRKRLLNLVMLILSGLDEENDKLRAGNGENEFMKQEMLNAIFQTLREFSGLLPDSFTEFAEYKSPYCNNLESILDVLASMYLIRYRGQKVSITVEEKEKMASVAILRIYYSDYELKRFLPVVRRFNELMDIGKN